ncbi:MAG: hypothetical protein Q9Q40_00985 [Acidobacteriota bacterium]|nr:hypothetical protein [Acidobacteriota bacterium]MDQ7086626.1 hypothetical protein [Acidobacteriota bacterium]
MRNFRSITPIAALVFVVVLISTGSTLGKTITFQLDEPIVIGDQVYPAGELVLRHAGIRSVLIVEINGRRVGLLDGGWGLVRVDQQALLVLERGAAGLLHLRSLRFRDPRFPSSRHTTRVELRPTALLPGLVTLREGYPRSETATALAQR